ncbi:MAG: hypothetical protein AB2L24_02090 [Mangrovibacterium sp.]
MKAKILRLMAIILLLSLMGAGCEKEDEYSPLVEGYIVGSFVCYEIDPDEQATGNQTERGYCILLESGENTDSHWPMDFYTFDLPAGLFDLPEEILFSTHNSNDGGPAFFPENIWNKFRIKFEYRKIGESERINFSCGSYAMSIPFRWENYDQVTLRNVSKIN